MKKFLIGLAITEMLAVLVFVAWPRQGEKGLLSPVGIGNIFQEKKKLMEVVGFLPTWMIGKTKLYGEELTQLIFSGIEVNVDGSLLWDVQSKKINSDDYVLIKNNVKKNGGRNLISIKLFTDKDMDKLIADSKAKQNLYDEVGDIVKAGKFDGVNVDFEYMSDATRMLDEDFGIMLDEMKKADWGEVNVDVFANTVIKGDVDKLKRLADRVDGIVVMAYDFHRPGADFAGAVAPIRAELGQRSVNEIIQKIIDGNLPKDKFIMAYPLYGYQWETISGEMNAATMPSGYGVTVLYKDGIGYTGMKFDELSQSPWFAWTEKEEKSKVESRKVGKYWKKLTTYYAIDQWHQAYLENENSLNIKVEVVKQNQLGGVGFWALGYEGKESNLINNLLR